MAETSYTKSEATMTDTLDTSGLDWVDKPLATFGEALESYLEHLRKSFADWSRAVEETDAVGKRIRENLIKSWGDGLHFTKGVKYFKVVSETNRGSKHLHRSVHSFIDSAGNIWKAAGYHKPALNYPRGNIYKPESYEGHGWSGL